MVLGEIIKNKRKELKITLDELSLKTGFSKPYLSTIETSRVKNPPSDQLLGKLEIVLQFEQGYLRTIAHLDRMPIDMRRQYELTQAENQRWRQLVRSIRDKKTDPAEIEKMLVQNELQLDNAQVYQVHPGQLIPVINKLATGYPVDFDNTAYPADYAEDYVRCPDITDPHAFSVRVIGDSMEERFHEGDIVIFSPNLQVHSGDDCFVRFAGPHETTFKRVFFEENNKIRLQPRNEKSPPTIVEADCIGGIYRAAIKYERL